MVENICLLALEADVLVVAVVQVVLCQKHSILHQLSQNMTNYLYLNFLFCTSSVQALYVLSSSNCSEFQNKRSVHYHFVNPSLQKFKTIPCRIDIIPTR